MKLKYLLMLLVFGMFFISCEEDIIEESQSDTIYQPPKVTVASGVSGIVTDQIGNALEEVTIHYKGQQYSTDENGYFEITDPSAREDGALLKFTESGYFENFKFYLPEPGNMSFLRVKMVDRNLAGSIDGTLGGSITLPEGAKIQFPANAFKDATGNSYNGQVNVYAHWYNPLSEDLNASMPGDLRATNEIGDVLQLATYGMMAVELTSSTGAELNLREGVNANLEFPLPGELADNAPDEILVWSFNENTGYWYEETTATKEQGVYKASVNHFSFWNCDAPFPVVEIYGKLVDEDGNALPYYQICIQAFNDTRTGYGWSGIDGSFRGKVPKGELLTFQVKDDCGNIILEQQIGPFQTEVSLGEIVVSSPDMVNISGRLVDCDGNPVSNGYAKIALDGISSYYIAPTDADGYFDLQLIRCQPLGNFTVQGWNLDDYSFSEIIEITNSERDVEIGEVILCEELEEFVQVKLPNGSQYLNPEVDAEILDGILTITTGDAQDSILINGVFAFQVDIENAIEGVNTDIDYFTFFIENQNDYLWANCGTQSTGTNWGNCDNVTFTITSLGVVGDYIEGEFMGEFQTTNSQTPVTLMGSFRVILDQERDLGTISGQAWNDEDNDGIWGANDFESEIRSISLLDANQNVLQTQFNVSSYEFKALEQGDYYLSVVPYSGSTITLKDQGGDETTDSDFDPNSGLTDLISLSNNEDLEDVDVGLAYAGFLECWLSNVFPDYCDAGQGGFVLNIEGSQGPFVITVAQNGTIISEVDFQNNVYAFSGLFAGTYDILVTDPRGNSCLNTLIIDEQDMECWMDYVSPICDRPEGILSTNVSGGQPPYSYAWSNGATTANATNLVAGLYTLTVTDSQGCTGECEFDLEAIGGPTEIVGMVFRDSIDMTSNTYGPTDYKVANILVDLYEASDLTVSLAQFRTNGTGVYRFGNVQPGDYVLEFTGVNEILEFVEQDFGTDDDIDSDVDPDTGLTDVITVTGTDCIAVDAGIR